MSSALLLIKTLSTFPALVFSSSSSSSSLVSKRACQKLRSRIKVFEWQLERCSVSSPLCHLQFGPVCSPVFSFDIAGMVEGEGERMGNANGSGRAEDKDVGKSIGKVERERDDAGNVKGFGKSIGKSEEETMGKSIGKVEAEGSNAGNAKGLGKSVGKSEVESVGKSIGKVEGEGDNAGNAKGVGKSVGKSEVESVGKSIGKVEGEGDNVGVAKGLVGKCEEECVGKSVGKVEGEGDNAGNAKGLVGKCEEEGVGKSIGKVEGEGENAANLKGCGKTVGKTEDEAVGKSVGKVEEKGDHSSTIKGPGKTVGKTEEEVAGKTVVGIKVEGEGQNAAKVEELARTHGKTVGKTGGLMSKSEDLAALESGHPGKVEKQVGGKTENENPEKVLEKKYSVEYVIAVAGKSAVEKEFAESLIKDSDQTLKLPEGATLVVYQKTQKNKEDEFRADVFMDQLPTLQFGRLLFYAHQLPSTHTLLSQNCKTLPVGALSVADVQFQGKGRAGNAWESPKGCLMFSFTLQMADGRAVPFLQYVVSLAVIEGIEDLCKNKDLKAPEVKIKWPNDLYAKGLKVGGVLCTSTYSAKKFHIVVGVGLNVGNRQPTTCLDALLEEINEHAPCLSRDELLAAVMGKFEELFNLFSTQGFYALETKYYERWLHSGQTVVLEEKVEGSAEVSKIPLKIQGLTPAGYLRAVDDDSETYELHPDGNSFDFLKGLVRKKM